MEIVNLWNLQGQLLLLLVMGTLLRRIGVFSEHTKTFLTDFVIYVTLPCSIILSFRMDLDTTLLVSFSLVLLASLLIQLFCFLLGHLLYRKERASRRGVLRYGILVSNAGFMGLPIAGEVFGAGGLLYASIYLIPQRVVVWTAGLSCFTTDTVSWKVSARKIALHPGIVSVYIGFFVLFCNPPIPQFVEMTMISIGDYTTPLSMLLIGSIIGEMPRSQMKLDWFSLSYCGLRLCIIPFIAFLCLRLFSVDPLVTGVSVLLAGMPVGSTTAILAAKYGGDSSFASQLVAISTVLSMISIPLWVMIL